MRVVVLERLAVELDYIADPSLAQKRRIDSARRREKGVDVESRRDG